MKDYPEAQEILQTLGRKRLMEVRCVNKKHQKKVEAALAATELANAANGPGDSSDSTSKRIVEKLRSDVKGLKNVLKKSTR
jgi:DNA-binding TFAR19-related protein (PDSD5 family)